MLYVYSSVGRKVIFIREDEEKMKRIVFTVVAIAGVLLLAGCPNDSIPTTYAVRVSFSGEESGESVSADVSEAEEGDTVTLTAALNSGRQVALSASDLTIDPSTISSDGGTATFTMPAQAVEVTATFSISAGYAVMHTANTVNFNMHYVPAGGPFTMGEHVESTTQSVTLTKNFWMGQVAVTQGLWEDVWGTSWPGTDPDGSGYGEGAHYPAYYVTWYEVVAFCNLLTLADVSLSTDDYVYFSDELCTIPYTRTNAANGDPVYVDWSKTGYRLPTEAEWEYAARYIAGADWNNGDHVSGDTEYACYEDPPGSGPESGSPLASAARISEYAWWSGNNSPNGSKEVGHKEPNALGLRDMSGNVYEWCYDWKDAYSGGSETNPVGPESGISFVRRGGFWDHPEGFLRCAKRSSATSSYRGNNGGFRLCRTAD